MHMKVLVPVDGSQTSLDAARRAAEMAEKEGAQVTLMTVAYFVQDILAEMPPNIQEKLEREGQRILDQAKEIFTGKNLPVETVLEVGTVPANNIIRKAQEGQFDRIIMGATGKTGLDQVLLGSTAAKVVAQASCEVVVVR
ncbi:MAG: universal stress protein [Syntrophobacterales bacterium]|nr:universal stress protein [Syntrophobacterales bacterium]